MASVIEFESCNLPTGNGGAFINIILWNKQINSLHLINHIQRRKVVNISISTVFAGLCLQMQRDSDEWLEQQVGISDANEQKSENIQ